MDYIMGGSFRGLAAAQESDAGKADRMTEVAAGKPDSPRGRGIAFAEMLGLIRDDGGDGSGVQPDARAEDAGISDFAAYSGRAWSKDRPALLAEEWSGSDASLVAAQSGAEDWGSWLRNEIEVLRQQDEAGIIIMSDPLMQLWLQQAAEQAAQSRAGAEPLVASAPQDPSAMPMSVASQAASRMAAGLMKDDPENATLYTLAEAKMVLAQIAAAMDKEGASDRWRALAQQMHAITRSPVSRAIAQPLWQGQHTGGMIAAGQPDPAAAITLSHGEAADNWHELLMGQSARTMSRIAFGKPTLQSSEHSGRWLQAMAAQAMGMPQAWGDTLVSAGMSGGLDSMSGSEQLLTTVTSQPDAVDRLGDGRQVRPLASFIVREHEFAQEMSRWMSGQMRLGSRSDVSEARIIMHPEHLGQVHIRLMLEGGVLTGQFVADSLLGRELLESQLTQLRQALGNLGIQVDKLDVSHNDGRSSGMFQDQRQQHSSGGQSHDRSGQGHPAWAARAEGMDALESLALQESLDWSELLDLPTVGERFADPSERPEGELRSSFHAIA